VPAAHYCCDGLTRPVLLTVGASCLAVRAFFRKLTGDSRVVAVFESTIARPFTAIPRRVLIPWPELVFTVRQQAGEAILPRLEP
jgi:hypothetical protein